MAVAAVKRLSKRLKDGHETVARVNDFGALDTVRAVIPVGAVQALMANTIDELVATIANSGMANVPARVAEGPSKGRKDGLRSSGLENVAGVVTVLVVHMAVQAEVVVFTAETCDKLLLWQDLDTTVASASRLLHGHWLLLVVECTGHLLMIVGPHLGRNSLSRAVDNGSILDEALDHPMALAGAMYAIVYAGRAEIVVAAVAYAAMEVLILHGMVAVIAVHNPRGAYIVWLGSERKSTLEVRVGEVLKETLTCREGAWHRSLAFSVNGLNGLWRRHRADGLHLG